MSEKSPLLCLNCKHNQGESKRGFMYKCAILNYYVVMNFKIKVGGKFETVCEAKFKNKPIHYTPINKLKNGTLDTRKTMQGSDKEQGARRAKKAPSRKNDNGTNNTLF